MKAHTNSHSLSLIVCGFIFLQQGYFLCAIRTAVGRGFPTTEPFSKRQHSSGSSGNKRTTAASQVNHHVNLRIQSSSSSQRNFLSCETITSTKEPLSEEEWSVRRDGRCPADFDRSQCPSYAFAKNLMDFNRRIDSSSCTNLQDCRQCLVGPEWEARLKSLGLGKDGVKRTLAPWVLALNWLSHEYVTTLTMILLREALGFTEAKAAPSANQGNVDFICCGEEEVMIDMERWGNGEFYPEEGYFTVAAVPLGYTGTSSLFVPSYTLDRFPMANAYNAYKYLPEYSSIFPKAFSTNCSDMLAEKTEANKLSCRTAPGPGKSTFVCDTNPWTNTLCSGGHYVPPQCDTAEKAAHCQELYMADPYYDTAIFEAIVKNNGLNFTAAYIGAGDYPEFIKRKHAAGEDFLFYWYAPDPLAAAVGARAINFDPITPDCLKVRTADPTTSLAKCAYPVTTLQKFARRDVLSRDPDFKFFFDSFSLDEGTINILLAGHYSGSGNQTVFEGSCNWLKNNYATWAPWVRHTPSGFGNIVSVESDKGFQTWIIAIPVAILALLCIAAVVLICARRRMANRCAPKESPLAILFTDVESSTTLWELCGSDMKAAMKIHNATIRNLIAEYEAYEVKTNGDSFMIACKSLTDATLLALAIQTSLNDRDDIPQSIADTYDALHVNDVQKNPQIGLGAGSRRVISSSRGGGGGSTVKNIYSVPTRKQQQQRNKSIGGGALLEESNPSICPPSHSFSVNSRSQQQPITNDNGPLSRRLSVAPAKGATVQNSLFTNDEAANKGIIIVDDLACTPNSKSAAVGSGGGEGQHKITTNVSCKAEASMDGDNQSHLPPEMSHVSSEKMRPWNGLRVRIGLHWCSEVTPQLDPMTGRYDYFGHDVNVCARVEGYATGGQIVVQEDTFLHMSRSDEFRDLVMPDVTVAQIAKSAELKGVQGKVALWSLVPSSLDARMFKPLAGVELPDRADSSVQQKNSAVNGGDHGIAGARFDGWGGGGHSSGTETSDVNTVDFSHANLGVGTTAMNNMNALNNNGAIALSQFNNTTTSATASSSAVQNMANVYLTDVLSRKSSFQSQMSRTSTVRSSLHNNNNNKDNNNNNNNGGGGITTAQLNTILNYELAQAIRFAIAAASQSLASDSDRLKWLVALGEKYQVPKSNLTGQKNVGRLTKIIQTAVANNYVTMQSVARTQRLQQQLIEQAKERAKLQQLQQQSRQQQQQTMMGMSGSHQNLDHAENQAGGGFQFSILHSNGSTPRQHLALHNNSNSNNANFTPNLNNNVNNAATTHTSPTTFVTAAGYETNPNHINNTAAFSNRVLSFDDRPSVTGGAGVGATTNTHTNINNGHDVRTTVLSNDGTGGCDSAPLSFLVGIIAEGGEQSAPRN